MPTLQCPQFQVRFFSFLPSSSTNDFYHFSGIPHGHTGHVRFLTFAEVDAIADDALENNSNRRISVHSKLKGDSGKLLVISGRDGYEDFRSSATNSLSEVAGREDSTNHLLLWEV